MTQSRSHRSRLLFLLLATILVALLAAVSLAAGDRTPAKKSVPAQAKDLSQYIGAETCKGCHEENFKKLETTPHWKTMLDTRRGKEWQGCEACHGPGMEHINAGGDKSKIFSFKGVTTEKINERCLACHQYVEEHSNFARSVHATNDVSCVSCHSIHRAKESQFLLIAKQPQLCFSCHVEIKPDFSRPFRHRVNEGLLKCTDCHNQHGGFLTKQLRSTAAQDVVCFKCHVDKAGPFTYEHHPVKTEGCMACHLPHGSANPRLLRRSQINLLCLECHTLTSDVNIPGAPAFHNQSQKYQACTVCHINIHGSNLSNVFFK